MCWSVSDFAHRARSRGSNDALKVRVKTGILVGLARTTFELSRTSVRCTTGRKPSLGAYSTSTALGWRSSRRQIRSSMLTTRCLAHVAGKKSSGRNIDWRSVGGEWQRRLPELEHLGAEKARKSPVIVYFYGAGGSADMPYWNGAEFACDGIVFVKFNYRYLTPGRFAHPALTKAAKPNEPLVASIRWISSRRCIGFKTTSRHSEEIPRT